MTLSERNPYEVNAELMQRIERLEIEIERLRTELHRVAESRRGQRERAERAEAELKECQEK